VGAQATGHRLPRQTRAGPDRLRPAPSGLNPSAFRRVDRLQVCRVIRWRFRRHHGGYSSLDDTGGRGYHDSRCWSSHRCLRSWPTSGRLRPEDPHPDGTLRVAGIIDNQSSIAPASAPASAPANGPESPAATHDHDRTAIAVARQHATGTFGDTPAPPESRLVFQRRRPQVGALTHIYALSYAE